ncbi:hypothetical protein BC833DRAFT_588727 [Globomyces pollinis-pini]|nr:hypothetical protein BC833DRAFT_588727 [Globomyces pollinis-pini]
MSRLSNIEQVCHSVMNEGLSKLTMNGMSQLEIKSDIPISQKTIRDALYRTIAKMPRLSVVVINGICHPAGKTLGDLDLDYNIFEISSPLDKDEQEKYLRDDMNTVIDNGLGYRFTFYVTKPFVKNDTKVVHLNIRLSMLHSLTDGMGLMIVTKCFAESLEESLTASEPLPLTTPLKDPKAVINIEDRHRVIPSKLPYYYGLFIFLFLWRLMMGIWLSLQASRNLVFRKPTFSGTKDPALLDVKNVKNPNGLRIIEIDSQLTAKLISKTKMAKGSVTSLMTIAATNAYIDLAEHHNEKFTDRFNMCFAADSRPFIDDHSNYELLQGNGFYPLVTFGYKIKNTDLFWEHVNVYKKSMVNILTHFSPMAWVTSILPTKLLVAVYNMHRLHHKRDYAVLISNLGNFDSNRLNLTKNVKVIDTIGSGNSFFQANRHLFQLTMFTIEGAMRIVLVYPTYMVTEEDADRYVDTFKTILKNAAESSDLNCLEMRKRTL